MSNMVNAGASSDQIPEGELEHVLEGEILRMYQDVLEHPDGDFHFFHGRAAAELFGYQATALDRAAPRAVSSFAGVGNPHVRAEIRPGETVVDVGSGAGLDATLAAWSTGPAGRVIGVDVNPAMCRSVEADAARMQLPVECRQGRMEDLPVANQSVDVIISNGVVNLSLRKQRVFGEMFRVLKPGGRMSITDIVSGRQLSQAIVNDPKLWAS